MQETDHSQSIALVIGLCSHGLAMVRALHRANVEVHAFESKTDIPGVTTKMATIHYVDGIKTPALIDQLLEFRQTIPSHRKIILFCTNDDNVRIVGGDIDRLEPHFSISWGHCADQILALLLKSNIESRCLEQTLNYPKSRCLDDAKDIARISDEISYPFIVKPVKPQSGFKVLKVNSEYELDGVLSQYQADLPFLAQEWIDGGDESLFFCALYLDRGEVIASYVGQKLASHPPAMGQTTVAVACDDDAVYHATLQFFQGLGLSGPVSLELKRDAAGELWVIEPTIGRTDFWVGLCVEGGCNLLQLEFEHCDGQPFSLQQKSPAIWFDSERDVQAVFRHLDQVLPWAKNRKAVSYSYWNAVDRKPFWISMNYASQRLAGKIADSFSIFRRRISKSDSYKVKVFSEVSQIPQSYQRLFPKAGEEALFLGSYWFSKMVEHIGKTAGEITVYGLEDEQGKPLALVPLWNKPRVGEDQYSDVVSSMTNYYSPLFDAIYDVSEIDRATAFYWVLKQVLESQPGCNALEFMPVHEAVKSDLTLAAQWMGLPTLAYEATKNYYLSRISSYSRYRQQLPSKLLHTIQRKTKKIRQVGELEVEISSGEDRLESLLKEYHSVYQQSWKLDEPFPEFISQLASYCADQGWLRVGVLRIDGDAAAAQIWFVTGKTACIYKLAYSEKYRSLSPGTLLTDKMMQHVIDVDGVCKVDFLTGSDPYKADWMDSCRSMYNVVIPNARNFSGLLIWVRHYLAGLRDRLPWYRPVTDH